MECVSASALQMKVGQGRDGGGFDWSETTFFWPHIIAFKLGPSLYAIENASILITLTSGLCSEPRQSCVISQGPTAPHV